MGECLFQERAWRNIGNFDSFSQIAASCKSTQNLFPILQESIIAMLIRYLSEWFQLGKVQAPHHGRITGESILALSFTRGKLCLCVWEGERETSTESKIVIAKNTKRQISDVFGYSLSVT